MKSRRMGWAWHVARMGEKRIAYRLFLGRPEGERPLAIPRHRYFILFYFILFYFQSVLVHSANCVKT
jgi:hypothetical protein